jgi:hypothetical protein
MIVQPYAFPSGTDMMFKGLTKREWFAGQVLAGLSSATTIEWTAKEVADFCYETADAMIAKSQEGQ